MIDVFYFFSYFSGLKPNLTKSEIAGIGVLKEVQETVCGMRCIDLNIETYSFLLKLKIKEGEKNYEIVTDIQRVLKKWKMRNLTLEDCYFLNNSNMKNCFSII